MSPGSSNIKISARRGRAHKVPCLTSDRTEFQCMSVHLQTCLAVSELHSRKMQISLERQIACVLVTAKYSM